MFSKITIELTKDELEEIIKEKIASIMDQTCTVEFIMQDQWQGYGPSETKSAIFTGAKVFLIPKKA